LTLTSKIHPGICVTLRFDPSLATVALDYHAGHVRVPAALPGEFKELSQPQTLVFTRDTVFYVGRHMFHVKYPDADAVADDNVAVCSLPSAALVAPPSLAAPPTVAALVPPPPLSAAALPPAPVAHLATASRQLPATETAPNAAVASFSKSASSASLKKLTAGTESRDEESKKLRQSTKRRRFANATANPGLRESSNGAARTPAVEPGPLAVPQAPRAHTSQSHSHSHTKHSGSQVVAAKHAAVDAPPQPLPLPQPPKPVNVDLDDDDDDDDDDDSSVLCDDAIKSRSLVNEFSNDGPGVWPHEAEIAINHAPFSTRHTPSIAARRASSAMLQPTASSTRMALFASVAQPSPSPIAVAPLTQAPLPSPLPAVESVPAVAAPSPAPARKAPETVLRVARKPLQLPLQQVQRGEKRPMRGAALGHPVSARVAFKETRKLVRAAVPQARDEDENEAGANVAPAAAPSGKKARIESAPAATPDESKQAKRAAPYAPKKAVCNVSDTAAVIEQTRTAFRSAAKLTMNYRALPQGLSRRKGSVLAKIAMEKNKHIIDLSARLKLDDASPSQSGARSTNARRDLTDSLKGQ
jgi:hypothetical protein